MKRWMLGLALALLAVGTPWRAAAEEPSKEEPSKWQFEFAPYAWIPGTHGTVNVKGRTAVIDTTVHDALVIATSGHAWVVGGYFSAGYDRWSVFADAWGGYEEVSTTEKVPTRFCTLCLAAKAKIKPVILDTALSYRIGQWSIPGRQRPISLGVYAGARYMWFGNKLSGSASVVGGVPRSANVSASFSWVDPIIGLRWEVPVIDRFTLDFRGDIGGFVSSPQLIWEVVGDVRYWLPWAPYSVQPWVGAGYRDVSLAREFGAGNSVDLQFRGPTAGIGFVF